MTWEAEIQAAEGKLWPARPASLRAGQGGVPRWVGSQGQMEEAAPKPSSASCGRAGHPGGNRQAARHTRMGERCFWRILA